GSNPEIYEGTPKAKAALWVYTDAGVRKHGEQTGSDTLVVHAVNDECSSLVYQYIGLYWTGSGAQLTRETLRLGSTVARLKLKGIDGGLHKRWSMWFNSIQRAEPYQPLTYERRVPVPNGM
ncbi:hypothetical protein KI387_022102, partial [Taxus chinensis]